MSRIDLEQLDDSVDAAIGALQADMPDIDFRGKPYVDNISAAMLAATAARFHSSGVIELQDAVDTASQLLVPLFEMVARAPFKRGGLGNSSIARRSVSPGRFIASTENVNTTSAPIVGGWIGAGCLAAGITVPRHLMGLVQALAYETISNAEEHGYVQVGPGTERSLRFFALVLHPSVPKPLSPGGTTFLESYLRKNGRPRGGWLEMIVADSGMGMSYPGYAVRRRTASRREPNLYEQPFEEEFVLLQRTLSRGVTTKGLWGRQVTSQSQPGAGSDEIAKYLQMARGYAAVRAGRSLAQWDHLEYGDHVRPTFDVVMQEQPVFYGTAWQLLIPLTVQLELFDGA